MKLPYKERFVIKIFVEQKHSNGEFHFNRTLLVLYFYLRLLLFATIETGLNTGFSRFSMPLCFMARGLFYQF